MCIRDRVSTTKVQFSEQMNYLSKVDAEDLIIIFSFSGIYYDYGMPRSHLNHRGNRPKIYFITSDKDAKSGSYDHVIWFDSKPVSYTHLVQNQRGEPGEELHALSGTDHRRAPARRQGSADRHRDLLQLPGSGQLRFHAP